MFRISRKFTISCSHRLFDNSKSDTENEAIFGKCCNQPSHGHNYRIELILESKSIHNGMVANFSSVKKIFQEVIDNKYDHQFLNDLMDCIPTAENMCQEFYKLLIGSVPDLAVVRIWETDDCYAEFTRE